MSNKIKYYDSSGTPIYEAGDDTGIGNLIERALIGHAAGRVYQRDLDYQEDRKKRLEKELAEELGPEKYAELIKRRRRGPWIRLALVIVAIAGAFIYLQWLH
jgi:hypothetical protein